jgi:hypothetical protein
MRTLFAALVVVSGLFGLLFDSTEVHAAVVDLKSYYPNTQLYENYYLEGMNHRDPNAAPTRSVLWFEVTGDNGDSFRLYNSGPEEVQNRCNWDQLSWVGDFLTYAQTHNGCNGDNKDVIYSSPIRFLPRYWDDTTTWTYNGSSPISTTTLSGDPGCTGTNSYTGEILGYSEVQPGVQAIHWRSTQSVAWATGNDAPYCVANSTTNWVENYYLIPNLPVENFQGLTSAPALIRTVGGNSDTYTNSGLWDWDVWFSRWTLLPWATPLSLPGPPQAGVDNKKPQYIALGLLLILPISILLYRYRLRTK